MMQRYRCCAVQDDVNDPPYCALRRRRLLEMLRGLPPGAWMTVEHDYVAQAVGDGEKLAFKTALTSLAASAGCNASLRERDVYFKKRR